MTNDRRDFLKLVTAGAAFAAHPNVLVAQERDDKCKKVAASDRVGIATIGLGGMGTSDTNSALAVPGVELVAVADVYDGRLTRAKETFCKDVFTTRDYREVLARKDVDAVIVATPDHWHAQIAIEAMNAGKDVYCEKPMVRTPAEGRAVIEAQKKTGRLMQVGSQRTSSIIYKRAQDLIREGAIGDLNCVEAVWNRNSSLGAWQYTIAPDASPENVAWDRFLGSAPQRPFEPIRLFRWRNYQDYGTGVAGDLFVHLFSGMHFITGAQGPTRIQATGGLRHWKDGRDVPDVMFGLYDYPKTDKLPEFTLSLRVNFADGSGGEESFRFVGPEGILSLAGDGITLTRPQREKEPGYSINTFPQALQDSYVKEYRAKYPDRSREVNNSRVERFYAPRDYSDHRDHWRNFIESVRTRKPPFQDPTFGLRAAGPAVLSNLSYFEKRAVAWDPETMTVPAEKPAAAAVGGKRKG